MIDQMIRCKDLAANDHVGSLNEWFLKCPPKEKEKQWKDGRSAKETAKHWLLTIPTQFKDILKPYNLKYKLCSPEFVTHFDKNGGNGRNHDLLILADDEKKNKIVISIESKVDEPFGDTIAVTIIEANKRLEKNSNSKGIKRIEELRQALFGGIKDDQLKLQYQLLTAVAGTLAEAKKQNVKKAFFLVQTFVSEEIIKKNHQQNQDDLDAFVKYLTKGEINLVEEGKIYGPIFVNGNEFIPNNIELYIGKYSIEI